MKTSILLVSLLTILSSGLAQLAGFQGTTRYQQGMSLSEAQSLATVSQEEAIAAAQTLTNSYTEATAEMTVIDGYLVWAVDFGSERVYVDANDASVSALATTSTSAYTTSAGDDDDDAAADNGAEDEHEDDDGGDDGGADNDSDNDDDDGADDDD